jgi:hypothetical protein
MTGKERKTATAEEYISEFDEQLTQLREIKIALLSSVCKNFDAINPLLVSIAMFDVAAASLCNNDYAAWAADRLAFITKGMAEGGERVFVTADGPVDPARRAS